LFRHQVLSSSFKAINNNAGYTTNDIAGKRQMLPQTSIRLENYLAELLISL